MNVELHDNVGVAAGALSGNDRSVPAIIVSFRADGGRVNYAMTVPTTRRLIEDLAKAVDLAIEGPYSSEGEA